MNISLSQASPNKTYTLKTISPHCNGYERLLEMGFIPGSKLNYISKLRLGGPLIINIENTKVAIRRDDAQYITIQTD